VQALLEKVKFNQTSDHLVFTGDMVFKGPDSTGVIDLARSHSASCVRGNHEDRILLAYISMYGALGPIGDAQPSDLPVTKTPSKLSEPSSPNAGPSEDVLHGSHRHTVLAAKLSREQAEWLQKCPVILQVGRMSDASGPIGHDFVVVHAGLAPGVPLDKQDPFQVMNMRTIDLSTRVPTELRVGEPWDKVWNHFQKAALPENRRKTVIYGHDSKVGLKLGTYTRGLDSGCVSGGKLTALVIDASGKEKIERVRCFQDYTKAHWVKQLDKMEEEENQRNSGIAA
jgi:calcineurin-like phosphoesterase family protein